MELAHGWFTTGKVAFVTENERRDGKGSFLSIYIRYGADKAAVTKAKVWSQNYRVEGETILLKDVSGAFAPVEVGDELRAWGTISIYPVDGNERVGFVIEGTEGLEVPEAVEA